MKDPLLSKVLDEAFAAGEKANRIAVGRVITKHLSRLRLASRRSAPSPATRGAVIQAPPGPGAKRTQQQIEQMAVACLEVIRANPGAIPERIAAALKVATRDITLPLARLRDGRQVTTDGVKRFTRYTSTASGPGERAER